MAAAFQRPSGGGPGALPRCSKSGLRRMHGATPRFFLRGVQRDFGGAESGTPAPRVRHQGGGASGPRPGGPFCPPKNRMPFPRRTASGRNGLGGTTEGHHGVNDERPAPRRHRRPKHALIACAFLGVLASTLAAFGDQTPPPVPVNAPLPSCTWATPTHRARADAGRETPANPTSPEITTSAERTSRNTVTPPETLAYGQEPRLHRGLHRQPLPPLRQVGHHLHPGDRRRRPDQPRLFGRERQERLAQQPRRRVHPRRGSPGRPARRPRQDP